MRDAEKLTGINHGNISRVCNKEYKHTKGFIFKFKDDDSNIDIIINPNGIKKSVVLLNKYNKVIKEYESIAIAAKINKLSSSQISRICNGKTKNNKQFKFKNYDNINK